MRSLYTMFLLILGVVITGTAQSHAPLFRSKAFTLTPDAVTEGKYRAHALSRTEIVSTYQSGYKRKTERTVTFKFSLNGMDNERMPGQDHHLTVRSVGGKYVSPVFVFGKADPPDAVVHASGEQQFLDEDADVTFRLDMRGVLEEFAAKGAFTTVTGETIAAADLNTISIAGATFPLTWNFTTLPKMPAFQLTDGDKDGIYEVTLHFQKETIPGKFPDSLRTWKLEKNIAAFPRSESPSVLADALYNKALEEMLLDMRDDGAFMAGEMWPGVWTRDVSFSIILSLAAIAPDASKTTLMAKVKNGRIIQDTGTGGSWPVSSDRTVWALAAWEVYLVTGDEQWLAQVFEIIKRSAEDDLETVRDPHTGLFRGESSFLDWREQTYPRWMDPKDIYASKNLGTNAVHFKTYRILASMAAHLGKDGKRYAAIADSIKQGMNTLLWQSEKGYYGQYLYGRTHQSLSPRSEGLGEALAVLYDIPAQKHQAGIIAHTPVTAYGIPCIYPQIPNMPPYHNDAVWPFVEAYWGWASAKVRNAASVNQALASVYRAAALYLTNKENLVSSTGDFMGTEINSSRQLWSVAGNLAMTYRILYGMSFSPDALTLAPVIPKEYGGTRTLSAFAYRRAVLAITINGYGDAVRSVTLDGKPIAAAVVPASLAGAHSLVITMNNAFSTHAAVTMKGHAVAPETPRVRIDGAVLRWEGVPGAASYSVVHNGTPLGTTRVPSFTLGANDRAGEFQVAAIDAHGIASFLSEPVTLHAAGTVVTVKASDSPAGYLLLDKATPSTAAYRIEIPADGVYAIDVEYANGSGPINTDNKCAVRTVVVDGQANGPIVMPQRGEGNWEEWGWSSTATARLTKGGHDLALTFFPSNENMNGEINTARIKSLRCTSIDNARKKQ